MKILITGGLGFIGTNLIKKLIKDDNYQVTVLDNYSNTSNTIDDSTEFRIIEGDIENAELVSSVVRDNDIVVHFAAHTRVIDSIETPLKNFSINVVGTLNILEAMHKHNIPRIINASTGGAILGEVKPPVHEEIAPKPMAPYGASKLAAEAYCSAYAHSYGMSFMNLRFSNVYGKYSINKASAVAAFIKSIIRTRKVTVYGDGSQTRDYLYVEDLADGIIQAIQSSCNGTYQLGSGIPTSINTLLSVLKETLPVDFECTYENFRSGEIKHTHCDISKARNGFGYNPVTTLQDGIKSTWEWYKENYK
jgi:UDP-glucose 4-epimerase